MKTPVPSMLVKSLAVKGLIAFFQYALGAIGGIAVIIAAFHELGLWRSIMAGVVTWLIAALAATFSLRVWARQTPLGKVSFGNGGATAQVRPNNTVESHIIKVMLHNSADFPIKFDVEHAYAQLNGSPVSALPRDKRIGTIPALSQSGFYLGSAAFTSGTSPLSGEIDMTIRYGLGGLFKYRLTFRGELIVFFDPATHETETKLLAYSDA